MKRTVLSLFIITVQLFLVIFFVNNTNVKDDLIVYKNVNVVHNNNLDKIATSVSVLFKNENDNHIVMVDDSIVTEIPSSYEEVVEPVIKEEEKKKEEGQESTPIMYAIDASKYKDNKSMGFTVTENNKNYELSGKKFDVVVAVVAGEYDRNLNDALAVVSVILNRCDSASWANWAGPSPYDQVVKAGQFEVYFEGYYLDYMPGGNKYGKEKYEVAKQAVIDGLNGIRNNKYLGFRAWWVSEYSDKYIVTGGNRYGYN